MSKTTTNKSQHMEEILSFPLGSKEVLWFRKINKYIIAESDAAELIVKIEKEKSSAKLLKFCGERFDLTVEDAQNLINDYRGFLNEIYKFESSNLVYNSVNKHVETAFFSKKYYKINGIVFLVEYETLFAEQINHPKFGHLEVEASESFNHRFQVFDDGTEFSLWVNNEFIGKWKRTEGHFASGKFSMQIIEKIYSKDESQWIGVFHAAGISNGKNCAMFFGESGSGKSTLSALLMAAGFDVLSDDFLPVENESALVFRFPAALSIKKKAYDLVTSLFPHLKNAEEHKNPELKKTFRYLAPENRTLDGVPCKALVMVKYDSSVDFQMVKLEADQALTHLIPDSWIHPSEVNARKFVQWFTGLEHYRLTYSNNEKMVSAVKKLLKE